MICDLAFLRLEVLTSDANMKHTDSFFFFLTPTGQKNLNFFHAFAKLLRLWHYLWTSPIVTQHVQKAHRFFLLPQLPKLLFFFTTGCFSKTVFRSSCRKEIGNSRDFFIEKSSKIVEIVWICTKRHLVFLGENCEF